MIRRRLAAAAMAVCATMAFGASYQYTADDYSFPSSNPPANIPSSDSRIKQYVTFIFDDNSYTGATGTMCEMDTLVHAWPGQVIGDAGVATQGQVGLYWALSTLGSKSNADGSPMHFTFNMITGLPIPTWGVDWQHRVSKFGGFFDPANSNFPDATYSIPRAWGREMAIGAAQGGNDAQVGWVLSTWQALIAAGHEIGNHTIDHMESNSPLPNATPGFGSWGGEGFDPGIANDTDFVGRTETELFGTEANAWAQTNGWEIIAGKKISQAAWQGAIELGEAQLTDASLANVPANKIFSFRAPRLETNSNQFFALKSANYQYDCGLEEGYDNTMSGANAWWPYTTDNGTPNGYIQMQNGETVDLDSMPSSLWEIPVNCMIVPQELRAQIYTKHRQINNGSNDGDDSLKNADYAMRDSTEWCGTGPTAGKVTCFDFNMFILYGMTKDEFVKTMVYNLKLRMAAGKAPLQFGCHTDYYTPIYDNMTLLTEWNRGGYGLNITKGWNTYNDRKLGLEAFRDSCIALGAIILSGHELIEKIKDIQALDVVGTAFDFPAEGWQPTAGGLITGGIANGSVAVTESSAENPQSYFSEIADSSFKSVDHVSLTYRTNVAVKVQLEIATSGDLFEALLTNVGPSVESGKIPISAFRAAEGNTATVLVPADVAAIHITPQWMGKDMTAQFAVSNVKVYGDSAVKVIPVANAPVAANAIKFAINRLSSGTLSFNAPVAGVYSFEVLSLNGKVVRSMSREVRAGSASVSLGEKLAPAMYIVKLSGAGKKMVSKMTVDGAL